MIEDIDRILGKRIVNVELLIWQNNNDPMMIETVLLEFDDCKLVLNVNDDTDEIIPLIVSDYKLEITEAEHKIVFNSNNTKFNLDKLIDKRIIWLWTMTNNQGYFDGIQVEVDKSEIFQFLVFASQIVIKRVVKI